MDNRLKLTIPAEEIESGAMEQIEAALSLDFLKTLAIMPDVHAGYDLPVGGVALLDGHVWPGAVGVDIGCGMCQVTTSLTLEDIPALSELSSRVEKLIPVGFAVHAKPTKQFPKFPNASKYSAMRFAVNAKASVQLSSLGGGNHFAEYGVNSQGFIGITIHSGSRGCGEMIGDFYMRQSGGPIPLDSDLAQAYLVDMLWAQDFALKNREGMMRRCLQAIGFDEDQTRKAMESMINENHNHAEVCKDGVLHRKGATPAEEGQLGIIPANMRDGVWITRGLGNKEFLCSASHGAGRAMSRGEARRNLDAEKFAADMDGIYINSLDGKLDEAPDAYKDIKGVLAAQEEAGIIELVDHFRPVLVLKG